MATSGSLQTFSNYTGPKGSERICPNVVDARGWRKVTVQWNGQGIRYANYSTPGGKTAGKKFGSFGGYSGINGTLNLYVGQNPYGPWAPVYVGTTKLSYTADGAVTFDNDSNYVTWGWTRTSTGINVFIKPSPAFP